MRKTYKMEKSRPFIKKRRDICYHKKEFRDLQRDMNI
jgi:hypothetical protein